MAIAELVVKLIGDISGFTKTMGQVGRDITRTGKALTSAGKSLSTSISLPMAGVATAALVMAGNFQQAMSKVSALGKITGADLAKLENQAIDLGASTQFSAKQAADGMGEFAAAGFNAGQIYDAMPGTLDLAAAAQISVAQAAEITVSTLGQFGLAASQSGDVADTMAKAAASGALNIQELAESLKYVGPVAHTMGISLADVSASIALLSNAGIKGEQAGTSLRMGLLRMQTDTPKVTAVIEKYGLSLVDAQGKTKGMVDIVDQLVKKNVSLKDLTQLVGVNAVSAWNALQNKGTEALQAITAEVNDHKGAAGEMAATLRDNLKGSFEQMTGSVETLGITLGMILTPAARAFMNVIQKLAEEGTKLLQWFRTLSPDVQNAAVAFGVIVGIIGPIVLVFGKITMVIGAFLKALAASNAAIAVFTSATGIGLIAVAIGAAVAAIVYFKDEISEAFQIAAEVVGAWAQDAGEFINQFIEVVGSYVEMIPEIFSRAWGVVTAYLDVILHLMGSSWAEEVQGLKDLWAGLVIVWKTLTEDWVIYYKAALQILGEAFNLLVDSLVIAWTFGLDLIKSLFTTVLDAVLAGLESAAEVVSIFSESGAQAIDRLHSSIAELKKPIDVTRKATDDLSDSQKENNVIVDKAGDELRALKEAHDRETKAKKDNKKATDEHTASTDKGTKATKKKTDAEKEAEKAQRAHEKAVKDFADDLQNLVTKSKQYEEILKKQKDGTITATEAGKLLKDLYDKASLALSEYNGAMSEYDQLTHDMASGVNVPAERIKEVATRAEEATEQVDKFKDSLGKKPKDDGIKDYMKDLETDLKDTLYSGLSDIFSTLLKGGSIRDQLGTLGGSIGSMVGTAAGGAFGGPFGAALGGAAGGAIFEKVIDGLSGIGKNAAGNNKAADTVAMLLAPVTGGLSLAVNEMFGDKLFGESAGTTARKQVDKFFADALSASRINIVIDGQLKQIKDIDFGGSMFGQAGGSAAQFFNGMQSSAQSAFSGMGSAFAELAGVSQEYAQGIAMALAENVGGSLNNLQVMIQGMGLSFEDMKKAIIDTTLQGKISFSEAARALNAIAQVAQDGIPDAMGATITAFQNLKDAGTKGGRYATDALKDIAFEAKELNIKTFPQLMANLLQSGKFTQKEIEQVFAALAENGIDSIDKLTSATDDQLIRALGRLEDQEFPFAKATDDARGMVEEISKLDGKDVDISFNIKTNLDSNTKEAIDSGFVPNSVNSVKSSPSGTPKQSRKGNVFSAGSIVPFAKGGIVNDYTTFNIGSMAEQGPEAIMPLERMANGDLGVVASGGGGNNYHIEINAPYAQPGVAETIRREVEKIFDTKNRSPGIRR